jgi:hypothetical protein
MTRHKRVKTGKTSQRDALFQRAQAFEGSVIERFFDTIIGDVNPKFKPDAEKFKECFLDSDPYKAMAVGFTRFSQNGKRRATARGGVYKNPTLAQQRTVDAWEGSVCSGVFNDLEKERMPCTRGPLDFLDRFIPVAENEDEDEDEDDSDTEDGAEKDGTRGRGRKINPLFAEIDHCHVEVARYAKLIVKVLDRGWLPALLYEEKVFRAMVHYMFSFNAPENGKADFVRGLGVAFKTGGPVQFKHHICHKADRHHGDTPFPPLENLVGFTLAQAKLWLKTHPPWIVPLSFLEPLQQTYRSRTSLAVRWC